MKKYIVLLGILFFPYQFIKGQDNGESRVKWYTLPEVIELQKKEPRKVIIDMYTDWCGWCKKMDRETYNNPVIAAYLNKYYYPVKFNAETTDTIMFQGHKFINEGKGPRSTHQLALAFFQSTKLQVAYPTVFYLDEKMQLITPWPGFVDAAQMEVLLHYIVDEKYKPTPLEEYKKTFVSELNGPKPDTDQKPVMAPGDKQNAPSTDNADNKAK